MKFSALRPGRRVLPHTGPTNTRIRAHLGLTVPAAGVGEGQPAGSSAGPPQSRSRLRIADVVTGWVEGEYLVIDDSFEHEVVLVTEQPMLPASQCDQAAACPLGVELRRLRGADRAAGRLVAPGADRGPEGVAESAAVLFFVLRDGRRVGRRGRVGCREGEKCGRTLSLLHKENYSACNCNLPRDALSGGGEIISFCLSSRKKMSWLTPYGPETISSMSTTTSFYE